MQARPRWRVLMYLNISGREGRRAAPGNWLKKSTLINSMSSPGPALIFGLSTRIRDMIKEGNISEECGELIKP